jgi:hypothetical protein
LSFIIQLENIVTSDIISTGQGPGGRRKEQKVEMAEMSRNPPTGTTSYSKRLTSNLLVCFATILTVAFAAEVIARAVYHPPNLGTVIQFDRDLGWTLKPK